MTNVSPNAILMDHEFEVFGKPLGAYADKEALAEGVLLAVKHGPINRMSRAVFDHYTKSLALTDAIRAVLKEEPSANGWRVALYRGKCLWAIPNEVGGLTLTFPEDY